MVSAPRRSWSYDGTTEIELRRSEIRQRLGEIAGLEGEQRTEAIVTEQTVLMALAVAEACMSLWELRAAHLERAWTGRGCGWKLSGWPRCHSQFVLVKC